MMNFENIGFSKPADGLKYLLCADCDLGPLGFQDVGSNTFYIAANRVRYQ